MATVIVHATLTLDGYLADPQGGVDWMFGRPSAPQDDDVVQRVMAEIGAIVGGANSISRQCLKAGLVDEIHLDIAPVLLAEGISLFAGLGERIELERLETSAFASEAHLRYRVLR